LFSAAYSAHSAWHIHAGANDGSCLQIVKMKGKMLGMGVATFFDAGGLQ
jgi:hypothetical protein